MATFLDNPAALLLNQGRIQDLPKRGRRGDHCERVERGSRAELPAGSMGRARDGGQGAKAPEAESFSSIFVQKRTKSLVFKLKKTPYVWSIRGGGAPGSPIPGSASVLNTFLISQRKNQINYQDVHC